MTTPFEKVAALEFASIPDRKAFEKPPTKAFRPPPLVKARL
jgi:hypothetical protein